MEKKRSKNFLIYGFTEYEHRALKSVAAVNGMSMSSFIKLCIRKGYKEIVGRSVQTDAREYQLMEKNLGEENERDKV